MEEQNLSGNGLYQNIHAKQNRIKNGSAEKPAQKGDADYPKANAFKKAAKTRKK